MIRCFVSNDVEISGTQTVNVVVTNDPDFDEIDLMEVHKDVILQSYIHHIPLGVKLALQSVDLKGTIHYETFFMRNYND